MEVEASVRNATSEILNGMVDWGMNLEICDAVSSSAAAGSLVKAVQSRLKVSDGKVQALALTLIETCVKNCGREVHEAVGTREFLGAVSAVAERSPSEETREKALMLIQQWAGAFDGELREALPAFAETYAALKVKGLAFPAPSETDAPVFTPPANDEADQAAARAAQAEEEASAFAKLRADLEAVAEKVNLCNEMVPLSPGVEADEALAEIVGFLEACRPRMLDLIDLGSRGALPDDLLAVALKCNDDLAKALQNEIDHADAPAPPPPVVDTLPVDRLVIDDDDDDDDHLALSRRAPPQPSTDLLDLDHFDEPPPPPAQQHQQPPPQRDFLS